MEGIINIALIQTNIIWENPSKNTLHLDKKIQTIDDDTDLIILPEMFNTGFSMNTHLSENMDGETVHWLKRKAVQKNCFITGSLMIQEEGKIYNRLLVVAPDGRVQSYDKRHLFSMAAEHEYFTPGNAPLLVNIHGVILNMMICYDLRFPVWSRNKLIDGDYLYDAIVYVANWPSVRASVWRNLLQARATENMAYVVGVNRIGSDHNGMDYDGYSAVIDPWGDIQAELAHGEDGIIYSRIDKGVLNNARAKFPVGNDADGFELK